jgi:hypothetical protein
MTGTQASMTSPQTQNRRRFAERAVRVSGVVVIGIVIVGVIPDRTTG